MITAVYKCTLLVACWSCEAHRSSIKIARSRTGYSDIFSALGYSRNTQIWVWKYFSIYSLPFVLLGIFDVIPWIFIFPIIYIRRVSLVKCCIIFYVSCLSGFSFVDQLTAMNLSTSLFPRSIVQFLRLVSATFSYSLCGWHYNLDIICRTSWEHEANLLSRYPDLMEKWSTCSPKQKGESERRKKRESDLLTPLGTIKTGADLLALDFAGSSLLFLF